MKLSPFLAGILGGMAAIFIVVLLGLGIIGIVYKSFSTSVICEKGKINTSRQIQCQITEVKDLGSILKGQDATVLFPEEAKIPISDIKTPGKFVQVKYKVKNDRKKVIYFSTIFPASSVLIDKTGRRWTSSYEFEKWVPADYRTHYYSVLAGLEREFIEIFEVPKDLQEPVKLVIRFSL